MDDDHPLLQRQVDGGVPCQQNYSTATPCTKLMQDGIMGQTSSIKYSKHKICVSWGNLTESAEAGDTASVGMKCMAPRHTITQNKADAVETHGLVWLQHGRETRAATKHEKR